MAVFIKPKLKNYQQAPEFTLPSNKDNVGISQFRQQKQVVLFFFRGTDCQSCLNYLQKLSLRCKELSDLKTEIVAISKDSLDVLKKVAGGLNLPFYLAADQKGEVISKYTQIDQTGTPFPTLMILDKYGEINRQWIKQSANELPHIDKLLDFIDFLLTRCPECGVGGG